MLVAECPRIAPRHSPPRVIERSLPTGPREHTTGSAVGRSRLDVSWGHRGRCGSGCRRRRRRRGRYGCRCRHRCRRRRGERSCGNRCDRGSCNRPRSCDGCYNGRLWNSSSTCHCNWPRSRGGDCSHGRHSNVCDGGVRKSGGSGVRRANNRGAARGTACATATLHYRCRSRRSGCTGLHRYNRWELRPASVSDGC